MSNAGAIILNAATTPAEGAGRLPDALPERAVTALADQLRAAGLFMVVLDLAGEVVYQDPKASDFYKKYVLSLIRDPRIAMLPKSAFSTPGTGSSDDAIVLPGAFAVAMPFVERKQPRAIIVVCGRAASASLGEDVVRAAGRLQLDCGWLTNCAQEIQATTVDAIGVYRRLLPGMVRDQIRVCGLEREVDSLSGQLADTYEELSLIYQVSGGMKINRRVDDFFRQACQDVIDVLEVRGMGFVLDRQIVEAQGPQLLGDVQLSPEELTNVTGELSAMLARRNTPLMIHDLASDPTFSWLAPRATQLLAVPLQRQEQVLGCLFALDKVEGDFDSSDSKLLSSIANESAIYLENAMLFGDVHGLMMGLLHSLTSAVDAKDAYTCGHSERVALVSRHLAQQAGLSDRDVEQIYIAGLLHDVGKIGVPEAVLQKAGRLTAEEFEQIKRHPQIGARILEDVRQLREIIPGVMHHHERYDGKGYPAGLWGESIPLMGRIICLADCFDAMTSSRTYRKALPLEVALAEIRRCSGTQFDPRLAELFLRTGPDGFRDVLRDHQQKARQLKELQEMLRSGGRQ